MVLGGGIRNLNQYAPRTVPRAFFGSCADKKILCRAWYWEGAYGT